MQQNNFKLYRIIGEINSFISASACCFDEAIQGVLKIVVDNSVADNAIVWCLDGDGVCRPYYWFCPVDITTRECIHGSGMIGRVCSEQTMECLIDFQKDASFDEKKLHTGIDPSSVVSVPFNIQDGLKGCLEFIRSGTNSPFSDEETEFCSILAMISEMSVKDFKPVSRRLENRKVILSAKNIRKSFVNGESVSNVLNGIDFDVFDGEFLCIQGESGCGKSTMLNIMSGLLDADSGSLTYMDDEILGLPETELTVYRRDNIGFVFQSYNLMPNLTAKENVDLISDLVSEPMDSMDALRLVGMDQKANSYPSQLSGGQQQRVSIARAIVKKPRMILADEPTAALDYSTSIEILSVFEKIKEDGTTIVMVTHNNEIARMADRVIRFKGGKIYEITVNRHPVRATELKW